MTKEPRITWLTDAYLTLSRQWECVDVRIKCVMILALVVVALNHIGFFKSQPYELTTSYDKYDYRYLPADCVSRTCGG